MNLMPLFGQGLADDLLVFAENLKRSFTVG